MVLTATDSVVAAPYLTVVIRRTYNSQGVLGGAFGGNWRLNTDWKVEDFGGYSVVTAGDGTEHIYSFDGTNYHGDALWYWTLSKDPSGNFLLTRPDRTVYQFNSAGQLASIAERNGNTITYHYDMQNRLSTITDPVSRTTTISYDTQGRLVSITDAANRITQYGYDSSGRLSSVTNTQGWRSTYKYDGNGRLVYAADPTGRWTALTYDDTGRASSVTDPLGERTTLAYATTGGGGGTTSLTDPLQGHTTFAYESHGFQTSMTDAFQNSQGNPKSWSFAYAYMASDPTKLQTLTITNPQGLQTQLTYDNMGNVTQSTDSGTDLTASGMNTRTSQMSYLSGSSDLAQTTDATGSTTTATWSTSAPIRLLAEADPLGHTTQYSYSVSPSQPGWITATTDRNGQQTQYAYDGYGNVSSVSNAVYVGSTLKTLVHSMTYNADGSVRDASELRDINSTAYPVTHTDYDNLGRKIRVEYPDGSMEAWLYDPAGNVSQTVTRGGQSSTYGYDAAGHLNSVSDNAGNTTSTTYDAGGNATAVTDALGHTVTAQYDLVHRRTRLQAASGMVTLYAYDEVGNVTAVTSGDQSIVGSSGYTVTATYYATGLLRQVSEPLLSDSVYGSSTGTTVYNLQTMQYNPVGAVTSVYDGNNLGTFYTYDAAHRLVTVTDAAGGHTDYAYDPNGNKTDVWDPAHSRGSGAQSSHFAYDALNRQITVTDPLGDVTSRAYDDAGNLASLTEGRQSGSMTSAVPVTTSYGYDLGHRLTKITYANATGQGPFAPVQFTYDGGGRRLFRLDDFGIGRYSYDNLGRLIQVVSPQENNSFTYDAVGNSTSASFSLGTVNYGYDAGNRMTTVTDPMNNTTTYSYDKYGHVSQVALPGGIQRNTAYYALPGGGPTTNRINSIANTNTAGTTNYWTGTYQYDMVGNVRNIAASWNQTPNIFTLTATYDSLYRLTQWYDSSISDPTIQTYYFSYDASGNRQTWGNLNNTGNNNLKSPPNAPRSQIASQNASYNAANRMATENTAWSDNWQPLTPAAGTTNNITQEPNGNASQDQFAGNDAKTTYTFNDANQLMAYHGELNDPGLPNIGALGWRDDETYHYDGDGRRVDWHATFVHGYFFGGPISYGTSTTTTNYKQYEYLGSDVVAERAANGNVPVWYIYGRGGEKLYAVHWSTTTYALTADVYAKDHLGSIREVIDSTGATKNWYNYDAYGQPITQNVSLANSYQFASAPLDGNYDSTSGRWFNSFYNLRARLYNPQAGRFLTQDTYRGNPWQPWTQNLYAYAGSNPVNYIDPTGHDAWSTTILLCPDCVFGLGHIAVLVANDQEAWYYSFAPAPPPPGDSEGLGDSSFSAVPGELTMFYAGSATDSTKNLVSHVNQLRKDNGGGQYTVGYEFTHVGEKQITAATDYAQEVHDNAAVGDPKYDVAGYNCLEFVKEATAKAGIAQPSVATRDTPKPPLVLPVEPGQIAVVPTPQNPPFVLETPNSWFKALQRENIFNLRSRTSRFRPV